MRIDLTPIQHKALQLVKSPAQYILLYGGS